MSEATGEHEKVSEGKLLYDPLFAKKPDTVLHDDPEKGLWGKTIVKKSAFIIGLAVFVSLSLFFSFNSVSKEKYKFVENGGGWLFSSYSGSDSDLVLKIDYVIDETGLKDSTKPVNEVRRFAVCCNEYLEYIYISDTVETIDPTSFYYCTALRAIIVDPGNKNYASIDGVLYKTENGVPTEIMLYPMQNGYYRCALAAGCNAPEGSDDILRFMKDVNDNSEEIAQLYKTAGVNYEIKDTATKIGQLCFSSCKEIESIKIPDSVTEIETLAFFKCGALKSIHLPDGLKKIGSDAFSSCTGISYIFIPSSVTEIGHHAFNNCTSAACVYMGAPDDTGISLGSQWAPQTRKVFMTSVEILYGRTREES